MAPPRNFRSNAASQKTRQALAEASRAYARRQKDDQNRQHQEDSERQVRNMMDYLIDGVKGLLVLAAIAFVALLIDGARREGDEFYANLAAFKPTIGVHRSESSLSVKEKMQLENKDAINTTSNGSATVAFPDGSAVVVEPSSKFVVRLLDYNRGPKRDRSFMLLSGSVFSRISHLFGKKGQTLICTPNAVAAARGTGYRVTYDPSSNTTVVEVVDGKVALRNAGGRVEIPKGQTGVAVGNQPPTLGAASHQQELARLFNRLARLDPKIPPIIQFERDALAFLDPVLEFVSLTPRGWNFMDNDWARRAATKRELQIMEQAFEAANGDVPDELNPITLSELSLTQVEKEKMLDSFAGFTIDRYEKRGPNSYRVVVRSRDSVGTTYEMTESGVREVK